MACLEGEIVVVDDEQGVLESFEAMLGDEYSVVTLDDGRLALEYLESHQPKLVFLDIKMPGMNGLEILRRLRRQKKQTAVVVVTATTQEQYKAEAENLGITAYLRKPFEVEEVEDIARELLP